MSVRVADEVPPKAMTMFAIPDGLLWVVQVSDWNACIYTYF